MTAGVEPSRARAPRNGPPRYRRAVEADLTACAHVWRVSLAGYLEPLGLDQGLPWDLGPIGRLFGHLLRTDPDRFWVATRPGSGAGDPAPGAGALDGERVVGFASANVRGRAWFLAMLFVVPDEQGRGIGQELLRRVMADTDGLLLGTATDSAQPISNALYARLGIVPRVPLLQLTGEVEHPGAIPALEAGMVADRMDRLPGDRALRALATIDRELLGYEHPTDHAFLRDDGRIGFLYADRAGRSVGYGYAAPVGRVGPVAALDRAALPAIVGDLLGRVRANGAYSLRIPGDASAVVTMLLRAGFRLESFPVLVAFSEPYADLSRYVPISAALL
jgi:GNAT superfamily N-acetyltransferase